MVQPRRQGSHRVWTIARLSPVNFDYLLQLPAGPLQVDAFQLIHGSPLDEDEYVISATDARNVFDYLDANGGIFLRAHPSAMRIREGGWISAHHEATRPVFG